MSGHPDDGRVKRPKHVGENKWDKKDIILVHLLVLSLITTTKKHEEIRLLGRIMHHFREKILKHILNKQGGG
jgi:hypothetical protein